MAVLESLWEWWTRVATPIQALATVLTGVALAVIAYFTLRNYQLRYQIELDPRLTALLYQWPSAIELGEGSTKTLVVGWLLWLGNPGRVSLWLRPPKMKIVSTTDEAKTWAVLQHQFKVFEEPALHLASVSSAKTVRVTGVGQEGQLQSDFPLEIPPQTSKALWIQVGGKSAESEMQKLGGDEWKIEMLLPYEAIVPGGKARALPIKSKPFRLRYD